MNFGTTFSGKAPSQRPDELAELVAFMLNEGVRSYLEIGARDGDSFHAIMSSLPAGSSGIAVDLPEAAWGKKKSRRNLERAIADLRERGIEAEAIIGDSTHPKTLARVLKRRAEFDFVLIDGDHRYAGVKRDWEIWGPLARFVAFHDIDGEGYRDTTRDLEVEVPRFWRELKDERRSFEIIGQERGMGIGVIER